MDVSPATVWWVVAGAAVAVELATGTFYLLMIALGLAAAALATQWGASTSTQVITAALVGGGATALWHWRRFNQPSTAPARENRDVNLDIGERVTVAKWADDCTARVPYRGSTWTARLAPGQTPASGEHRIVAVEGNWLVLARAPSV